MCEMSMIKKNRRTARKVDGITSIPSPSMRSFGASPTSILNMTTLGVMDDIWLLKQYLNSPSM